MSEFTKWLAGFVDGHQPTTGCSGSPGVSAYPHGIAGSTGPALAGHWPGIADPDHLTWRKNRHMEYQQRLIRAGFDPGPVDGIWSPKIDAAIRAFQASVGICIDGAWGSRTEAAMLKIESIVAILKRCEQEGHVVTVTMTYGDTFTGKPSFNAEAIGSRRWWFISQPGGGFTVAEDAIAAVSTADGWIKARDVPDSWAGHRIQWKHNGDSATCMLRRGVGRKTSEFDLHFLWTGEVSATMWIRLAPTVDDLEGWIDARDTPDSWVGHRVEWKRGCDPSRSLPPTTGAVMLTEHMTDDRGSFSLNFFRTKIDGTLVRLAAIAPAVEAQQPKATFHCSTCKDSGTVAAEDADGFDYGSLCMACRGQRAEQPSWELGRVDDLDHSEIPSESVELRWVASRGAQQFEFRTERGSSLQEIHTLAFLPNNVCVVRIRGEHCHEMAAYRVLAALKSGVLKPS